MDGTEVAAAYVRLGLRLDRVVPGVLDAHLGDPADADRVAAEPPPDPAGLARDAAALRAALPGSGLSTARTVFLDAQLVACRAIAEGAVDPPDRVRGFVDEVEACFGVRIAPGDPDRYREVHRTLDGLLSGGGPLAERLAAFRRRDRVPTEQLGVAVGALSAALRARTARDLGLPAGEEVTFDVVDAAPWSGFSRRVGPLRSRVSVNASAGHRTAHLPLLVAHEAYPGHHTEHCRTEAARTAGPRAGSWRRAARRSGSRFPEREVFLARTPQSLVAEGAAELGLDVLVGPGWGRWNAGVLRDAGLDVPDELGALGEAVEEAMTGLAEVRQDAALMLHAEGRPTADVVAHLRRWLLVDEARARRMLEFVAHPRWRTHTTTYVEGARLLRPWLAARPPGQPVTARFARLLDEPWTPATLRVSPAAS